MNFKRQEDEVIVSWVREDLNALGNYLMSGIIHGKPGVPVAELGRIEKVIQKNFTSDKQYQIGKKLIQRKEYTARNIGTHLLVSGWPQNKDVESQIKIAADDEDWIVREYAAGTFAQLLTKDFPHFSKLYLKWVKTESINIKRAIALAVKYDAKPGDPKKWRTYFKLIHPLMAEEAEYIRKNLGPFAIGDGLLSRYPDQILKACKTWMSSKNKNVRWNTAMVFTAAAARKFATQAKPILKHLEKDPLPFVSRAALKAQKNLTT